MDNLKGLADAHHLWQNHFAVAKKGGLPSGGATHQVLTENGIGAQQLTAHWALAIGYCVVFDLITNLFPSQPGCRIKSPFIASGNHTDTPPAGGKFDKTFGVPAGLGALENTAAMPALRSKEVASGAFLNAPFVAGACPVDKTCAPGTKSMNPHPSD